MMATENVNFQSPTVPKFDGDYEHWSLLMKTLLRSKEYWVVIEPGYTEPREGAEITAAQHATLEAMRLKDLKAQNYLFQSIDKQIIKTMTHKETAKQIWEAMRNKYQGNARVKKAQLQRLRREFETLEMKEDKRVTEYFGRVMTTANEMRNFGEEMTDVKVVEKILRSLTEKFNYVVCSIEESKDTDQISVDELQSSLLVHEQKFAKRSSEDHVLRAETESSGGRSRGRGRSSFRGRGRGRGRGRADFDKSNVECYRCHQLGHFSYECTKDDKAVNYAEFDEGEDLLLMTHAEIKKEPREGIWFLDSGCSNHMTGARVWFIKLDESFRHTVKLGNDIRLNVRGIGDVRFEVGGISQIISQVYYVPELTSNLISVGQLQEKDLTVVIKRGTCKIYHPQRGLITSSKMTKNRMFIVNARVKPPSGKCLKVEDEGKDQMWHKRLGHLNHKALRVMQYNQLVIGLPKLASPTMPCEVCNRGKQQREIIPKKGNWRARTKLELIHTDLCGPIEPESSTGKRYIMVLIDDFSRKGWVYFLIKKSEAFDMFKIFKTKVEKETGLVIKSLRSDRGGEFTSNEFNYYCESMGIKRQLTTAYTPQQNGVAERRNRTLLNMVRCLLFEKNMPKWFWAEAANWACHILNRCATSTLIDMVPEEVWSGIKPNINHFKIFESIGFVHIPSQLRSKLEERSHKCIFLGISFESKAYRMYDPIQGKIIVSKDVVFSEMEEWVWSEKEFGSTTLHIADEDELESEKEINDGSTSDGTTQHMEPDTCPNTHTSFQETLVVTPNVTPNMFENNTTPTTSNNTLNSPVLDREINEDRGGAGTSRRQRTKPGWMIEYESGEGLSDEDEANLALFSSMDDPTCFEEAVKEEKWNKAMESEMQAIQKNATWELVDRPAGVKPIGVKWLFKTN